MKEEGPFSQDPAHPVQSQHCAFTALLRPVMRAVGLGPPKEHSALVGSSQLPRGAATLGKGSHQLLYASLPPTLTAPRRGPCFPCFPSARGRAAGSKGHQAKATCEEAGSRLGRGGPEPVGSSGRTGVCSCPERIKPATGPCSDIDNQTWCRVDGTPELRHAWAIRVQSGGHTVI